MITLDYVLKSKNVEGRIYLWDVKQYFGIEDNVKAEEIRIKLEEICLLNQG